ncbi:hypothetical protein [Hymenobacter jeollabukensis]|uniref:Uncharacterized protein n=1 Tax=Hymenobacter jeollabukensis TaxID=2025313 RepID=A0A5R8WKS9_9BACT|nr:hypothetical protein [Hymenobacter jeollabukensis]TLM89173.1 hypothetical protein FDY95_21625 [Hymenobacter jeollabukensis]
MLRLPITALLLASLAAQTPDCPRSAPEPVVRKAVFANSEFKLNRARTEASETVKLGNGDQLTIHHSGCEYYGLSFRFNLGRPAGTPLTTRYWYPQAAALLRRIAPGIDAPVHLAQAEAAITRAAKASPRFGQELDYGGPDIRELVVVNSAYPKKTSPGRYTLAVDVSVGPL